MHLSFTYTIEKVFYYYLCMCVKLLCAIIHRTQIWTYTHSLNATILQIQLIPGTYQTIYNSHHMTDFKLYIIVVRFLVYSMVLYKIAWLFASKHFFRIYTKWFKKKLMKLFVVKWRSDIIDIMWEPERVN